MIGRSIKQSATQHDAELSTARYVHPGRHYANLLPIMKTASAAATSPRPPPGEPHGQGTDLLPSIAADWPAFSGDTSVGEVNAAVWSPRLGRNVGYVRVPIGLAGAGSLLRVESEHGTITGRTAAIPFVDPRKQRPTGSLRAAS